MAETTGISWCDATFNPWVGCEKVSPGCAHCYAETLVTGRMGRAGTWGADGVREVTSAATWAKPHAWAKNARLGLLPHGQPNLDGHRPRVFCASLADVFEPRPELEEPRHRLFALIEATPELDWLLLTKRPEEAHDWLRKYDAAIGYIDGTLDAGTSPMLTDRGLGWGILPNVWLGVSIENARHTFRADVLRTIPAAVRFISAEPLLGSLFPAGPISGESPDAADALRQRDAGSIPAGSILQDRVLPGTPGGVTVQPDAKSGGEAHGLDARGPGRSSPLDLTGIDWVIVGGESGGRDARPMHPEWAREIRDACKGTYEDFRHATDPPPWGRGLDDVPGPALHFKQWGSYVPAPHAPDGVWVDPSGRSRGQLTADATGDLPDGSMLMRYAGASPKSGGKLLDGQEWCEFPESRVPVPA